MLPVAPGKTAAASFISFNTLEEANMVCRRADSCDTDLIKSNNVEGRFKVANLCCCT